ncbi:glycosyltransferase family 2 protein [Candidatus Pacearchaeota archaeon]|nr:glycosyltransferase family 2 protein [Candidatus Pacearchaeota archaeon]
MTYITAVIPMYNEEENISPLYKQLTKVLKKMKKPYELLFIDDGSDDKTPKYFKELKKADKHVRVITFKQNKGQSAAMSKGFSSAKGKIIITLDGDLQNDPSDIPRLIKKLETGFDVVCGWRYNRKDSKLVKKIPSKLANYISRKATKAPVHDLGCTLRAYKTECVKDLKLFKGGHRHISTILHKKGCKLAEVKVKHNPRFAGKAKYNSPFRVIECIKGLRKVVKNEH